LTAKFQYFRIISGSERPRPRNEKRVLDDRTVGRVAQNLSAITLFQQSGVPDMIIVEMREVYVLEFVPLLVEQVYEELTHAVVELRQSPVA
jgi:hypothetical protein